MNGHVLTWAVTGSPKGLYTITPSPCGSGCDMRISELDERRVPPRGSQPAPQMLLITNYLSSLSQINASLGGGSCWQETPKTIQGSKACLSARCSWKFTTLAQIVFLWKWALRCKKNEKHFGNTAPNSLVTMAWTENRMMVPLEGLATGLTHHPIMYGKLHSGRTTSSWVISEG